MVNIVSKADLAEKRPTLRLREGVDLSKIFKVHETGGGKTRTEFLGTGDFAAAWTTRQRYEVESGRREEPILYDRLYSEVVDANLPKIIDVYTLLEGGVVFEEVVEGGEAKFASVNSRNEVIRMKHYAVALKYSKDLFIYNDQFRLPLVERATGKSYNALKNHIAFSPIIGYSYASDNITNGNDLVFDAKDDYQTKILKTIEAAIEASMSDEENPRPGPYVLLAAPGNKFIIEKSLSRVPQMGSQQQSSAIDVINDVVLYRGWSGKRGKKSFTYPGVTAGTAYLCDLSNRESDFQSWVKQDLESEEGNPDVSRFIKAQVVWDTYFAMYCAPQRAVQKIVFPTAAPAE